MKNTIISACYFIISFVFISFRATASPVIALILKAIIMPLLMLLLILNIRPAGNRLHLMIIFALIFSWMGDIFLEIPEGTANLFIPGLVSFMLAHVMYLTVFLSTPGENIINWRRIYFLLPVAIYGIILLFLLYDSLGEMKLPVIIYTLVILTMVCSAISRYGKVSTGSWLLVTAGAILFLLSDSGIAINKFYSHFPGAQVAIMSSYVLAQYLIITGYIREHSDFSIFR